MTRYLLDGRPLQDASAVRGIGTYVRGLLHGFERWGRAADVGLLLERGGRAPTLPAGIAVHPCRLFAVNRHLRPLVDPLQVRWALARQPPLLYHAVDYAQPILPPVPVVLTVHDLIPFVMPTLYPWMRRERALAMRQFRRADAVIAVSESTAADLRRLAGVDERRITVIPEGVAAPPPPAEGRIVEVRRRLDLPARFLLAVGTFDPRKRIDLLAEVVRAVRTEHPLGLVVAGSQGNFSGAMADALMRAGVASCTRVLGHVSADDLQVLYQTGECLVFTSAYEGFGLPPLEAMAAGMPVVVFGNSSLREVVGDAGLVVTDGDVMAMAAAVRAILSNPHERERRAALGRRRAGTFTWDRAAAATLDLYSRVVDGRSQP